MSPPANPATLDGAKKFVDSLPVWGVIVNREKEVLYRNAVAKQLGVRPETGAIAASRGGRMSVHGVSSTRRPRGSWCHRRFA